MFLAFAEETACGIAGSYVEPENRQRAQLVSMWVDPAFRRAGVGKELIDAVIEWNRSRGARRDSADGDERNSGAIEFYERLGFAKTGVTDEYPNDAAIIEYEMMLKI